MLVEMKALRERIMDLLNQSNVVAAMFMVSGKEPTGDIREDLKNVRAISFLDFATSTTGTTAGNRTFSHRATIMPYGGYGAQFYQDGSQADALFVEAFPIAVFPQDRIPSYDAATLFGYVRNAAGYMPQNPLEYANVPATILPGAMISDYGTQFNFRKFSILSYGSVNYTAYQMDYSVDGVTWTNIPFTSRTGYTDFTARYIRYTPLTAVAKSFSFVWQVIPKQNAYTEETIDKVVLCRSAGLLNTVDGITDPALTNYIGLTLDIGTDLTVSDAKSGTYLAPHVNSFRLAFDTNVVEAP